MLYIVWVPCDTWGLGGSRGMLSLVFILTWCQKKSRNMDKLQPPSALVLTGNLAETWLCFKQQFQIYIVASGLVKKDRKV